jgi:RHS repeat-associated protein
LQITGGESRSYTLDNAFRITGISNASTPSASWTYGYDSLDRITSANAASNISWTYDGVGNRQTQVGAAAPTYAAANMTLAYNNRGRMSGATATGTTSYIYNALGQRVSKSGLGATLLFAYDEAGHLIGEYSNTGALIQETVYLGDTPVATIRPGSPVGIYYVHADHLNTPKLVSRPNDNAVMWRWDQEPFGVALPNQNPSAQGTFSYNLRFPGQYYDSETGLSQNYFRDYDSQVGRYVESDPVGLKGGINTYAYTGNDPIDANDPLGLYGVAPPKPGINTIVCDGEDGIEPRLLPLDPGNAACGLGGCIKAHELSHIADVEASNKSICKGKRKGMMVVATSKAESAATEIKASEAEIACLKAILRNCDSCSAIIKARIAQTIRFRDSFK